MGIQKKKCTGCKQYKPASAFHSFGTYPNGKLVLGAKCKTCIGERTPIEVKSKVCSECLNEFTPVTPFQKHCGHRCVNAATKPNPKKKTPTRTEKALVEFDNNKKEIREEMIEARGHVFCQREECQKSTARFFHFHHIIFRSEKPNHPMIHCKRNLIHVCDECHDLFHNIKGIRNQIVVERWLDKVFGADVLDK